jgi:hypothetical protein
MYSIKKIIALAFFLMVMVPGFSQPGSNPGGGVKPGVPISGIEILILIGGAVGARKILSTKRK